MDDRNQLGLLTLNIGSPSVKRAERQLDWLAGRDEDVFVLTETRGTAGTQLIAERLTRAGWKVLCPALPDGERGVLVACRVRAQAASEAVVSYLPGRVGAVTITGAGVNVVGVYVPSRDESEAKVARKARFVTELSAGLQERAGCPTVLLGDLNVLEPDHRPRYPFFRDWEYALYTELVGRGWIDAYRLHRDSPIEHSWVGPDDDGFRFDHVFVTKPLEHAVRSCAMLHETRHEGLTDHSALTLTLTLACASVVRLDVQSSLSVEPLALF